MARHPQLANVYRGRGWDPEHPHYEQRMAEGDAAEFAAAFDGMCNLTGGSDDDGRGEGAAAPPDR